MHMGFPLYVTCCFSLAAFIILSLCLVLVWLICVLVCFSLSLSCIGLFMPLWLDWHFPWWENFQLQSLQKFSHTIFLYSSSGTPIIQTLVHLILFQRSLGLSSVFFILLPLFFSSEAISTILPSSSLIHSASDILVLIPSRIFLISIIVLFVFVCLFFNSSRSLLIDSYISPFCFQGFWSSLLSLFWILFQVVCYFVFIYLDFCVSILSLHLCSISLPFHFFFLNLCLRSPFPRLQGWILSFGFFPPNVGPVVCVSLV